MSKRWISILGTIFFFVVVFCVGFLFFYSRIPRSEAEMSAVNQAPNQGSEGEESASSKSLINTPFPNSKLVDSHGSNVDEQILRKGRVVVVFVTLECGACSTEIEFLKTVIGRRKDVAFYGLVPFGRPSNSDEAEKSFPFKVFFDESGTFVSKMGINRVPIKVFLEDGIIKKGWMGAVRSDKSKTSFTEWLDGLP